MNSEEVSSINKIGCFERPKDHVSGGDWLWFDAQVKIKSNEKASNFVNVKYDSILCINGIRLCAIGLLGVCVVD